MKILLFIPALLLIGCVVVSIPLYDKQPDIVKVDAQIRTIKRQVEFFSMMGMELDLVAAQAHVDLISAFYTAMEIAFVDGDAEKFQSMINRINTQVDALEDLIAEAKPIPLPKEIL